MALLFAFGTLVVCSVLQYTISGGTSVEAHSFESNCNPVSSSLSEAATLLNRQGHYRLTLVEVIGDVPKREAKGSLTLRRHLQDLNSLDGVSTPLYGYTSIDLQSVGAHRVGDPNSRNPQAPGVLVLESDRAGRRVITMRIGSEANRSDSVRYDGAYTVLEVLRICENGFAGQWRSGLRFSRTTGYFCARKQVP